VKFNVTQDLVQNIWQPMTAPLGRHAKLQTRRQELEISEHVSSIMYSKIEKRGVNLWQENSVPRPKPGKMFVAECRLWIHRAEK
jgi:hypothetical protein